MKIALREEERRFRIIDSMIDLLVSEDINSSNEGE